MILPSLKTITTGDDFSQQENFALGDKDFTEPSRRVGQQSSCHSYPR
jgi:hypothetical protein